MPLQRNRSTLFMFTAVTVVLILTLLNTSYAEIHRAKIPRKVSEETRRAERASASKSTHPDGVNTTLTYRSHSTSTWVYTIVGSLLVGLCGVLPLILIPVELVRSSKNGEPAVRLRLLLSFAVGALLGDVFLHLLPEAWDHCLTSDYAHDGSIKIGAWVMVGLISFMIIEKAFPDDEQETHQNNQSSSEPVSSNLPNGNSTGSSNGCVKRNNIKPAHSKEQTKSNKHKTHSDSVSHTPIKTSGWLNLTANVIDNFTHGLAVGGSFIVSPKTGVLTTLAILLHEIPHEVGDFAILLRSGFDRWKAAKAQLLTASGGLFGAIFALLADSTQSAGDVTLFILPFTSGGFLYIALVTVVPDLLKETSPSESFKHTVLLLAGISSMGLVSLLV